MLEAAKRLRSVLTRLVPSGRPSPIVNSRVGAYSKEFSQALKRTSSLGLSPGNLLVSSYNDCIDIEQTTPVLQRLLGGYTEEQVARQCLTVNYQLKPLLEEQLGFPLYLTIDWYEHFGQKIYEHDEQLLTSLVQVGAANYKADGFPFHCWLTSPAHEVLDATLPTTIASVAPQHRRLSGAVYYFSLSHPTREVVYHPTIVGEDFLLRIHEQSGVFFQRGPQ